LTSTKDMRKSGYIDNLAAFGAPGCIWHMSFQKISLVSDSSCPYSWM
jgi:hypothetical protein